MASVKVPPNFRISVLNQGQAVPGIQIAIYDAKDSKTAIAKPILRMFTGSDGGVQIGDLEPGPYIVQTEGPGQGSAVYAIVATNHLKPSSEIKLEWPYSREKMLKSRTLAGEMVSNDPWDPFENIHLELWTSGAAHPLAIQDTSIDGRFHFDETEPGIYVLRIHGRRKAQNPANEIVGEVAVELSPSAPDATEISLHLDTSDCGIEYSNCPFNGEKPLAMASRRIQVRTPPGMAEYPTLPNARYKLLNDRGVSIAEGTTDENGAALLPSNAMGRTTLVVAFPLLSTLQQKLDLLTLKTDAPDLAVTLDQMDKCSTASLENNAPQK